MEKDFLQNVSFLQSLFDSIPSMLFVMDDDVRVVHLNAAARQFNGADSLHRILGSGGQALNCINVEHDTNACGRTENCRKCLVRRSVGAAAKGRSIRRETTRMQLADKRGHREAHFLVTSSPFVHDDRSLVLLIMEDISELKQAEERLRSMNELLERQATTDHLTGITNRQRFTELLHQSIDEARRYRFPISLTMFDIDHFKAVNDRYGHAMGDRVLKEVVKTVGSAIRNVDVLARWGGEEFMVLSRHTDGANMGMLAEKLRTAVADLRIEGCHPITCSFGVTELAEGDTAESFAGRADAALYEAKRTGRNRVCGR